MSASRKRRRGGSEGAAPAVARRHRAIALAAGVLLAGAFYLLLIDTTDLPELYTGAAGALLAGLAFEAGREQGFAEASLRLRWLARVWRPLLRIPADIALVSWAALRALPRPRREIGTLRAIPFEHGPVRSSRDAGIRAVSVAAGSLAPNTIIIGIDSHTNLLLAHQLRRHGGREALDVLELR